MHPKTKVQIFAIITATLMSAVMLVASIPSSANAQEEGPITMKAEAGFDRYIKPARWIPVHITIENKGPAVEANVQASYKIFNATISVFSADVSLPTSSRKEFFLYVYPQGSFASLNVNVVVDQETVVRANVKVSNLASESRLVGLLSDTPSAYNVLSELQTRTGQTRLVELDISQLPDAPQGWEALDVIIVSGVDTGELSPAQRQSLELWIAKGGSLLVMGGPRWRENTAGLAGLLPINVTGTSTSLSPQDLSAYTQEEFPAESPLVLATGDLTADAKLLAGSADQPFLVQNTLGNGQIVFLAADPALAPLEGWDGLKDIYDYLLNFQIAPTSWSSGQWDVYSANQALGTISELGVPSIFYICGWIFLYIAAIGPVNYIFLRIIKRRELAWVSIPVLAILFSTVAYFSGYLYRGTNPTLNRISVIQAWDGVDIAQANTLLGLYSPQREQYTVESADGHLLLPYNTQDANLMGNTGWYSVQQERNVIAENVPIEIGDMKVIAANGTVPALALEHDLTIELSNSMPEMTGTITNMGITPLQDAILVTPGSWKEIGDLLPGEPVDVDLSLAAGSGGPAFFTLDSMSILGLDYMDIENNETLSRRNSLLQSLLYSQYGANNMNWGIYLMGWLDEPPPSATIRDVEATVLDTSFYIHQLSPATRREEGAIRLSPAMFQWESSAIEVTPYGAYQTGEDEFTLEFRPALPMSVTEVRSLTLHLDSYTSPATMTVSLWDFDLESWVVVENIFWGNYDVPDPGRYVNALGEVRMMVADNQNTWVEMSRANITMEILP
jgi:hypothetical protein